MAILTVPNGNTQMVRYSNAWSKKKWHILKPKYKEVGICGVVCLDPEYEILFNVKANDICGLCWQFEKYDGEFKEPKV